MAQASADTLDTARADTRELLAGMEGQADIKVFYHPQNRGKGAALRTAFERGPDHPGDRHLDRVELAEHAAFRDHERDHPAAYNMKMCLGECLAVAVHRHVRYRQVAQRYLDLETVDTEDPVLAFVVARAYSKVAEIDPAFIDLGTLLRVAMRLDADVSVVMAGDGQMDPAEVVKRYVELVEADTTELVNFVPPDIVERMSKSMPGR